MLLLNRHITQTRNLWTNDKGVGNIPRVGVGVGVGGLESGGAGVGVGGLRSGGWGVGVGGVGVGGGWS